VICRATANDSRGAYTRWPAQGIAQLLKRAFRRFITRVTSRSAPGSYGTTLQGPYAVLCVVDRGEKSGSEKIASFRASIRSFLFPAFNRSFFRGSHTSTSVTCGLSGSCNHAAQVPSSKVTCTLPRSPWTNCKIVAAFVSTMDSINSCRSSPEPQQRSLLGAHPTQYT